ncbi:MAG: hypothetical protein AW07_04226 [Candidatus Accumulibacter sp. SK-11]|nr:MAG: hypothetical protein AW07_04226 [Candidatus Accumulibacter sp. SK-11]
MTRTSASSRTKSSAAGTVTCGPWSPPMQSIATVMVMRAQAASGPSRRRTAGEAIGQNHAAEPLATFLPR